MNDEAERIQNNNQTQPTATNTNKQLAVSQAIMFSSSFAFFFIFPGHDKSLSRW